MCRRAGRQGEGGRGKVAGEEEAGEEEVGEEEVDMAGINSQWNDWNPRQHWLCGRFRFDY